MLAVIGGMANIDDFKRWKIENLRKFGQVRGLSVARFRRKEELVVVAFAASSQNLPVVASKVDDKAEACKQYVDLLTLVDGTVIPDPEQLAAEQWLSESEGLKLWPPCMVMNISDYLISKNERPLYTRLAND